MANDDQHNDQHDEQRVSGSSPRGGPDANDPAYEQLEIPAP